MAGFMDGILLRMTIYVPASSVNPEDHVILEEVIEGRQIGVNQAVKLRPNWAVPAWADRLRVKFERLDDFSTTMDMQGMLTLRFRKGR